MDEGDFGGGIYVNFSMNRGWIANFPFQLTLSNPPGFNRITYQIITDDVLNQVSVGPPTINPFPNVYTGPITITTHCLVRAVGENTTSSMHLLLFSMFYFCIRFSLLSCMILSIQP